MLHFNRFGGHPADTTDGRQRRRRLRSLIVAIAAILAAGAAAFVFVQPAASHGTSIAQPSRHYSCWERWGSDFQNPAMEQEDPMCWAAWQNDTNAMWNWNGLYREQVGGDHQAAVPDNQLCSGGRTGGTRYAPLDEPGAWKTTPVNANFTFTNWDQANHGADYYRIYVSKQGYDAQTDALDWADLELVKDTGDIDPGVGRPPATGGGTLVDIPVSAPGRTGHHVVYMIWQASHQDQTFYACSDVWFGPGGPTPTITPDEPSPTTDEPTEPDPTTEVPTTGGPNGYACTATAAVNSWGSGATVTVKVANTGTQAIHNWMLHWQWPSGVTVSNSWNATLSTMGGMQMAAPASYNQAIPVGGSVEFGLNVAGSLASAPAFDCLPS
ncbi:lytic polysaccharide monooxygenase auxiliary activity family 9 protein [Glycomyces algeriensis]|uniref:lytic polysaccharide monooxygenase auxiliary activity family 9 protein n=1 Tax=Glycomyces algeriensis TaxID=256037 RepID=UPI0022D47F24|nr:lytic polysaccharide monooxygenase [Glycomyces algeriensis]MDA1366427.1 lytic polysaccharide monooxygenase [Glycomyces algeriensis]MDR7352086.1 chitin-binding protein [Glycomyces algeriensis]